MNELNPKNAFGELLLDLIEAQYEGDFDSGIAALSQTTGMAPEEIEAIVNGDTIVEDADLLEAIVDAFPDADDDDLEVIVNVATAVNEEDREALLSEMEAQEAEMSEAPEMEAAYGYGYNPYTTANFSAPAYNPANDYRLAALENEVASFKMAEFAGAVKGRLAQLNFSAEQAVMNGELPRSYKVQLIGDFQDDDSRLARFSQMAAENGVDVPTMLFAAEYAMGMFKNAAQFVEFQDFSVTDEDLAVANFSANLDHVVSQDIQAIFSNGFPGV